MNIKIKKRKGSRINFSINKSGKNVMQIELEDKVVDIEFDSIDEIRNMNDVIESFLSGRLNFINCATAIASNDSFPRNEINNSPINGMTTDEIVKNAFRD